MIDRHALPLLRPLFHWTASMLNRRGISANQVTLAGFALGLLAAFLVGLGWAGAAMAPLLAGRALDGIDGALARLSGETDRGAFLDISLDFIFYAAMPLAFALHDPAANALAAAVLLAAFVGTGTSFLAFSALAGKRALTSKAYPDKAIYYLGGLAEGGETLICLLAMCWWPSSFAAIAYGFAILCAITTLTRLIAGWRSLGGN
ncbi:MAG: CDP-alcohol phosphatidyltransferase family protein [Alphaproteobacteria bacterium]|nr:CDP-alcohol phosphatidyltransferase family protein [Alphaproteobacteria bacterium]